jgi:hypothetical protein
MVDTWRAVKRRDGTTAPDSIQDGRGYLISRYRVRDAWKFTLWQSAGGLSRRMLGTYDSAAEAKAVAAKKEPA